MACLDTTTLVDLTGRAGRAALARASECVRDLLGQGEVLCTTRLNVAELWVGVYRSKDPAAEEKRIDAVLGSLVILELDSYAAQVFGQISADLLHRGRPVGEMDVLIAAIALDNDEAVVTRNRKHFEEIQGLQVVIY